MREDADEVGKKAVSEKIGQGEVDELLKNLTHTRLYVSLFHPYYPINPH
jgi:hypothetical protein